jgi:hypothetical protein
MATALLGLAVYIGMVTLNVPQQARLAQISERRNIEQAIEAFNLFYRTYNADNSGTSRASTIEGLSSGRIKIEFSNSTVALATDAANKTITIGNASSSLNGILSYRVIARPPEDKRFCRFTTVDASNSKLWNYSCASTYNGLKEVFDDDAVKELPIAMIDGRICFLTDATATQATIDTTRNSCLTPTPTGATLDHRGMFTVPRLVVFDEAGSFNQAIFESLFDPVNRFTTSNTFYPKE